MSTVIVIDDDGDETCFVKVNEEVIGEVNHGDFGWGGMEQVIDLIKQIGETFGIEVRVEQDIV